MTELECFLEQHPDLDVTLSYMPEMQAYQCRVSDGERVLKRVAGVRESVNCRMLPLAERTPSGLAIHRAICAWNGDALNRAGL